jgi:DNA polymerase-4
MWIVCYQLPLFALACERQRRPELRTHPIALVTPEGRVRVVSDEAKRTGVEPGMATSAARIFCPDLEARAYDLPAYEEAAEHIWNRIAQDSSFVEPISPEVCFATFTGPGIMDRLLRSTPDLRDISGTAVQAGMSVSRFTARIAASRGDGNRPVVVCPGDEKEFLSTCPIVAAAQAGMSAIGSAEIERLDRLGVRTLGDVLSVEEKDLHRLFKEKSFLLRRLARGLDRDPVRAIWPPMVIEHAVQTEDGIADAAMLDAAMRLCAESVGASLKHERKQCRRLTLELRYDGDLTRSATEKLRKPEDQAEALLRATRRLLGRMPPWEGDHAPAAGGRGQRKGNPIEVVLLASAIGLSGSFQPALLDDNQYLRGLPHERQGRLDAAVQLVCERFGPDVITSAARQSRQNRPRQCRLWTYPLTRRLDEGVEVVTDPRGDPIRYARSGQWWDVMRIQNRWSEADWRRGQIEERMVFRVEVAPSTNGPEALTRTIPRRTDAFSPAEGGCGQMGGGSIPIGLSELQRCGSRWCLTAMAD